MINVFQFQTFSLSLVLVIFDWRCQPIKIVALRRIVAKQEWQFARRRARRSGYRFTTYQDASRARLVDGLETNILRVSPVNEAAKSSKVIPEY